MSKNIFAFNWLAVCVAAVVSESKKAVSAVAAAVVGIGLFLAPMEKAQAQTGMPEVTELFLWATEASGYGLYYGWDGVSVGLDTSSAYFKWDEVVLTLIEGLGNPTIYDGYFTVRITPASDDEGKGDCIDVFFYVWRSDGRIYLDAWVVDSEGNEYDVDVSVLIY